MRFKSLFIVVMISSYLNIYSQSRSDFDIGIEGVFTTKGVFSYPRIGFDFNNFKLQSGVLIGKEYSNSSTAFGGEVDLLVFPNKENNKAFNLFFVSSISYFRNNTTLGNSKVKTNFIQATFGYGFNYYFSKNLFVKSNVGLGAMLENRKFNFSSNDPTNKWEAAGMISFGIIYRL